MKDNTEAKQNHSSFGAFLDGMQRGEDTKRAYTLFHRLWGKAHDNDDYVKTEWSELNALLSKIIDENPFKF